MTFLDSRTQKQLCSLFYKPPFRQATRPRACRRADRRGAAGAGNQTSNFERRTLNIEYN